MKPTNTVFKFTKLFRENGELDDIIYEGESLFIMDEHLKISFVKHENEFPEMKIHENYQLYNPLQRMLKYAEEQDMISQLYYELLEDEIGKYGVPHAIKKGETLSLEEAKKWEKEAESYEHVHKMDDGTEYISKIVPRSYRPCYRKIKPMTLEEFPSVFEKQDDIQQNQISSDQQEL